MCAQKASSATKAEFAYREIQDLIRSRELKPGQRVTLLGLADQLGMSLTPIREALRMAAERGLVVQESNKFTAIAEVSFESAIGIYRLRMMLEPLATELAVGRMTDELAEELRALCESAREVMSERPADVEEELPRNNWHFHMGLYRAAGDKLLLQFIERLWSGVPYQRMSMTGRHETSVCEHEEIVEAITIRNADRAADLMRSHIQAAARDSLLELPASLRPEEAESEMNAVIGLPRTSA